MFIQVIGIDLGKSNFHLVAHDRKGNSLFRKKFSRKQLIQFLSDTPPTTIAFEACGGAHWLGRLCLKLGHSVKLLPPQYVRPYVKGNKNDFIDADAIAEASQRPSMRFVEVKSEDAQLITAIYRVRQGYIKDRTACMCRIGALLLEFGVSLPQGHATMKTLFTWLAANAPELPTALHTELNALHEYYKFLNQQIKVQDDKLTQHVAHSGDGQLLQAIPGIGVLTASQCMAELGSVKQFSNGRNDDKLTQHVAHSGDGQLLQAIPGIGVLTASQCMAELGSVKQFSNGRNLAAWLGLVPHQHSTGGKPRLLGISKRGNKHLRTLFIHGARAILARPEKTGAMFGKWLVQLRASKPFNVVCVALANKLARIVWAVLRYKEVFNAEKLQSEFA